MAPLSSRSSAAWPSIELSPAPKLLTVIKNDLDVMSCLSKQRRVRRLMRAPGEEHGPEPVGRGSSASRTIIGFLSLGLLLS